MSRMNIEEKREKGKREVREMRVKIEQSHKEKIQILQGKVLRLISQQNIVI